jgi:hypothetical protein
MALTRVMTCDECTSLYRLGAVKLGRLSGIPHFKSFLWKCNFPGFDSDSLILIRVSDESVTEL